MLIDLKNLNERYGCTCALPGEYIHTNGHQATCDLFQCDEWIELYVDWDNVVGRFVILDDPLDDVVDDIDVVLEAVIEDEPDVPSMGEDDQNALVEWWTTKNAEAVGTFASQGSSMHTAPSGKTHTTWKSCDHAQTPVTFPDGTVVYAHSAREYRAWFPDFGLYMDPSQLYDAEHIAYFLPWTDYGLPVISYDDADALIEEVFELAKAGHFIEVGCFGAHGRTGVVLAEMAILGGVAPDDAVRWVRANYCKKAIEGREQEWYVRRFAAVRQGQPIPPKPEPPKPLAKATTPKDAASQVVMSSPLPAFAGKQRRRNRKRGRRRNK